MFPLWVLLSFIGVVLAVGGVLFDKYLLEKYFSHEDEAGPGALIIFSSYFLIIVVMLVTIFKFQAIDFSLQTGLMGLSVGIMNGFWILLYLIAINRIDVSKVIPLFQTVPIFGLLFGMVFLGEFLSIMQIIAATIIILGALFLMYTKNEDKGSINTNILLIALTSAFFVALSQVIFKMVSLDTNYWTATFWLGSGFVLFGVALFFFMEDYRIQFQKSVKGRLAAVFGANSVNEIFDNAGELVFLAAIILGPVALVQSMNAYEPLLVFVASIALTKIHPKLFDEDTSKNALYQKIIGIIIILIGSLILYKTI